MSRPVLRWDIFCQVIDNFGDIGVCWRLAADLAQRGHAVCLRVDDATALAWMAPQGVPGVQVLAYDAAWDGAAAPDVVVEAFGCEAPGHYLAALALQPVPLINLEYLSAESYVERCHRLPSPIFQGPGQGLTRWFFYPGFTPATGGLLREVDLLQRQAAFERAQWRQQHGVRDGGLAISLFCYEPAALPAWLQQCAAQVDWQLLVTPGRASAAVQACVAGGDLESWRAAPEQCLFLPPCSQTEFDALLWACDLNLVRGEDSLVRALWAGQPLVWHIYAQEDGAHHAKLQAFLDWLQAPTSLRDFHYAWNGMAPPDRLPVLDRAMLAQWGDCVAAARQRLLAQNSLIDQLQMLIAEKS